MQTTKKSTDSKTKAKTQLSKEESNTKKEERKHIAVTPRNYLQKASTTDIYGQKNATPKAPKKLGTTKANNSSPMNNLLKASASSISQISRSSTTYGDRVKTIPYSARKLKDEPKKTQRNDLASNAIANSPKTKKKFDVSELSNVKMKNVERDNAKIKKKLDVSDKDDDTGRQRTKTRTLHDDEVKVLTPDAVDNNVEMLKLSRKLAAKPKVFYVDLDEGKDKTQTDKVCDEDDSYEEDFESYESDFDSYHSSHTDTSSNDGDVHVDNVTIDLNLICKENEEKMLDSGNFELREALRSANHSKPALDFIQEDKEADIKISLTDEGFQEMSTSSSSSMKTVHVDVLDRPLLVDFSKSKANKRKRKIFENLKQRAKDILSMVTLHEMSYTLFEMKPIPYDLFMATFGRSNFTQTGVQTFEDGITEEVQTDGIEYDDKWTQHPIEFSNNIFYLKGDNRSRKYSRNCEDYLSKLTFLMNKTSDDTPDADMDADLNYKNNHLRLYFEQKNGAGNCKMLPYETYKSKLRNNDFNVKKLGKFLKKVESRISRIVSLNNCDQELTDVVRSSKFPFSKGYVSLSNKNITDEKLDFVKHAKITNIVFSDSKSNLIMTIHKKSPCSMDRCVICLWDLSVARKEPVKVLIAIDDVEIGRFRGNTDGIFAAALADGSIHLWDLSEKATWRHDTEKRENDFEEVSTNTRLTQTERDREWDLQNRDVSGDTVRSQYPLQACSYTSSASVVTGVTTAGRVVALEMGWHAKVEGSVARKVVGQVCTLQNIGILLIWSIIQDKSNTSKDMGKAYWSKMKLEINQKISLIEHLNIQKSEPFTIELNSNFNLNAAKRRTSLRRKEKVTVKKVSRLKSAISFDSDRSDRPSSAASAANKKILPVENSWETGIVCNDFKIMNYENSYSYLVAKNCGEVLSCSRSAGSLKVNKLSVSTDMSNVTSLAVSTDGLPYFLAATDSGTINLCSVVPCRVLLTLDCRNRPQNLEVEKYNAHHKGRFIGSVTVVKKSTSEEIIINPQLSVNAVLWSSVNPCCVFATLKDGSLAAWELTHSDIQARCVIDDAAIAAATARDVLALVNSEGEVQIHRVGNQSQAKHHRDLFSKYAALL
ncbi:uncharacterized protein LOC128681820 [Plodia interpunctella]|uniref:uncharacterized protein LOC128681820 n=1 Tax=Plodia interpunctella TaxID=58824 RepID=UPI0023682701|nr:uncharacterized protein LOC128681820 [Plodia interpunctella]